MQRFINQALSVKFRHFYCNLKWNYLPIYTIYKFTFLTTFSSLNYLKITYTALAESTSTHGICVCNDICNFNLSLINVTQRHILKIVFNKPKHYPNMKSHFDTVLLIITQLFIRGSFVLIHKDLYYKKELTRNIKLDTILK